MCVGDMTNATRRLRQAAATLAHQWCSRQGSASSADSRGGTRRARALRAALVIAGALACTPRDEPLPEVPGQPPPPDPGTFTLADFGELRWLEGQWRGFARDGETFYEQYRFLDDSTIVVHQFADSTFAAATDSSRVTLRDGLVANDGASARWVATRLDSAGVDFAPHHGAVNHFTWTKVSATAWDATLRWTDEEGRPQTRVFALHRFGR